jgi:hypothetical protein
MDVRWWPQGCHLFPCQLWRHAEFRSRDAIRCTYFPNGCGRRCIPARKATQPMLLAAARALRANSPALKDPSASLLPALTEIIRATAEIAVAVGIEAQKDLYLGDRFGFFGEVASSLVAGRNGGPRPGPDKRKHPSRLRRSWPLEGRPRQPHLTGRTAPVSPQTPIEP